MLVPALMALTRLETLKLVNVIVRGDWNVFTRDGLLDDMLDRNPGLVSLTLWSTPSCLTMTGASTIYTRLAEEQLKETQLGLNASFDMLRGRPDLWIRHDERMEHMSHVQAEFAKLQQVMKDTKSMSRLGSDQLKELRRRLSSAVDLAEGDESADADVSGSSVAKRRRLH